MTQRAAILGKQKGVLPEISAAEIGRTPKVTAALDQDWPALPLM
jgi:hypothetical protein